jgi:predicted transcriptional regulator
MYIGRRRTLGSCIHISAYREKIHIIEDIILKLVEYGCLNQTALISFCGLNLKKHRFILDELESNGLISKSKSPDGKRTITIYKPTQEGVEFCKKILEPYEKMFPRGKNVFIDDYYNNSNIKTKMNNNKIEQNHSQELSQRLFATTTASEKEEQRATTILLQVKDQ